MEEEIIILPCGADAFLDGVGYRCLECMAIYGSIACGCTNQGHLIEEVTIDLNSGEVIE